jgi:ATP-binding cassette subfamily B protein
MSNAASGEGSAKKESLLQRVRALGLRFNRLLVTAALILSIISAVIPMTMPLLLSAAINDLLQGATADGILLLLVVMVGLSLLGAAISMASGKLAIDLGFGLGQQLSFKLYDHVIRMPYLTYATVNQGVLNSRLTNDLRLIEPLFVEVPIIAVRSVAALVTAGAAIVWINPWYLPALFVVPLSIGLVRVAERNIDTLIGSSFDLVARISRIISNTTSDGAVRMMRQAGTTRAELADYAAATGASSRISARLDFWRATVRTSYNLSFELGAIAVLGLALMLTSAGGVSVGGIISALLYLGLVRQPLSDLVGLRYPIVRAAIGLSRIESVLRSPNAGLPSIIATDQPLAALPAGRRDAPVLEFHSVWFKYPSINEIAVDGLSNIETATSAAGVFGGLSLTSLGLAGAAPEQVGPSAWTLSDVSLSVRRGTALGVGGASGAGKTTLVGLACGLFRPTRGTILIGGRDTAAMSEEDIWRHVSLVSQDIYLRAGTLRDTLAYGLHSPSDTDLLEACHLAGLGSVIAGLGDGLDTLIGADGKRFSGGERQRISIARAFLKNPDLLVLDEATSHLDSVREADVLAGIEKLRGSRAVLVIAHRVSALAHSDRVLMIEHGHVIEEGRHGELMRSGGAYARLHHDGYAPVDA